MFSAVGAGPDPVAFLCTGVVFELGTVVQLVFARRKFAYTTIGKYHSVMLTRLVMEVKAEGCLHNDWKISDVILIWLSLEDRADVCLHNDWKISDVILIWLSLEDRADVCLHNDWKISDCHTYTGFYWKIKRKSAYTKIGKYHIHTYTAFIGR